ncbi:MAG: PaaI family thioesterase [Acidobacteria bacterium]|nr:PaaI family thioesterase [Acidobacteriota bacterium]
MTPIRHGLSGLEYFKKMIAGEFEPPPMLALLGMKLVEAEEGRVVFTATVEEKHYNGMGVAHGGFAATLLDSSLGCCINTLMPAGKRFTTLELKVNLTRPLTKEVGLVRCEATVVHVGGRTATSEGRIVDSRGKLYAHGTTTCIIVEERRGKLEP